MSGRDTYIPRLVDPIIDDVFATLSAIMLVGPRATGKTTTAARHAETVVRLDRERENAAFRADPDAAPRPGRVRRPGVAQPRAEVPACESRPRIYHLRQDQGRHEVDIVLELGMGRVIGIEVKAAAAPRADDAKHLRWLRDELGDRFVAGVVLHTGPRIQEMGEKIIAAPVCALWS